MFSLILKIQFLLEKLKKRKALWFTTITALSLLGILSTMYYLNTMTQRSTKNLYEATNTTYFKNLDAKINDSLSYLELAGSLLLANADFVAALDLQDDPTAMSEKLNAFGAKLKDIAKNGVILDIYNQKLIKVASSAQNLPLTQEVQESESLQKTLADQKIYTIVEYEEGKVYLKALFPTEKGVLVLKRPTDFLVDVFEHNDMIFHVLLDRDYLDMKRLQAYTFQRIGKDEVSVQSKVDPQFLQKMQDLDFDAVIEKRYTITGEYFILAKPMMNLEGKKVGMLILAENLNKENSLPNMVHKISTGLTTAAIGLVVALLVLMI